MKSMRLSFFLGILFLQAGLWAQSEMSMSLPMPLNEPMGSGTAWLPASSPVHEHAFHFQAGDWNLMAHGDFNARYTRQNANNEDKWRPLISNQANGAGPPGPIGATGTAGRSLYPDRERGGDQVDLPNWAMLSADRVVWGEDRLLLRVMMSLDPLTEGRKGYPLLFQTGEGLTDRQHAHDLFMEMAALYKHHFTEADHAYLYLGLPGEPALGPAAFMHRPSAWNDPDAPLAHHMQDATHITYGVATAGWIHRNVKLEGSCFRGREPDNDRWNIERPGFDSYSLRLGADLGESFSLQGSGGYLQDTEPDAAGVDLFRGTLSLDHNIRIGEDGNWASAIFYGSNTYVHGPLRGMTNSLGVETNREFNRAAIWGRWESLERLGGELDLPGPENRFFWVHALTAGAGWTVAKAAGMECVAGGQGTLNVTEKELEPFYGKLPLAWEIFLKLRPAAMKMHGHMHPGMESHSP